MDNSGNMKTVPEDRQESFQTFDRLPPELRSVLNNSVFKFNVAATADLYTKHGLVKTVEIIRASETALLDHLGRP